MNRMDFQYHIYKYIYILYIYHIYWLVVWNIFYFPYIGNVIIPIEEVIFFRGVAQPPTRRGIHFANNLGRRSTSELNHLKGFFWEPKCPMEEYESSSKQICFQVENPQVDCHHYGTEKHFFLMGSSL